MNKQGLLLCAWYAIAPNFYGYCGPDENLSLTQHLKEKNVDSELNQILSDFEILFPYLKLIAKKNKIIDPFDYRVVEAYWIGNFLLKSLTPLEYQAFLKENLLLNKKLNKKEFQRIFQKIDKSGFLPHHNFHVFNIFKSLAQTPISNRLQAMDTCRINFGKLIQSKKLKSKSNIIYVRTNQLIIEDNKMKLEPTVKSLKLDYKGENIIDNLDASAWISFHWGFVCDVLTEKQQKNLEYYTQKAIEFYNIR